MALTRLQNIEQRFTATSFSWDATGLLLTITSHKFIAGITVTVPNIDSAYDSITGVIQVVDANTIRVVSDPVLGRFAEVIVRGFLPGQTGYTDVYSIRKGEGSETVLQSWVTGTGGAAYNVELSMDGTHWINSATVTHTTVSGDTGGFTFTAGWAYIRFNITSLGASTILSIILGD